MSNNQIFCVGLLVSALAATSSFSIAGQLAIVFALGGSFVALEENN